MSYINAMGYGNGILSKTYMFFSKKSGPRTWDTMMAFGLLLK
jgi:hypothetical protein